MKIALGSDHAGYKLKEKIKKFLKSQGISFVDVGTNDDNSVDYPLFAEEVAKLVKDKKCDYGIIFCGTGIGMAIVANKLPGIRAVAANDAHSAKISREHNDANILTLGARVIDDEKAKEIVKTWLATDFLGGRHARRVNQISEIEKKYSKSS